MIPQLIFPADVASKMFPADSKWLLPNEPPSITWLAGQVVCEACDGCGDISYPEWEGRRQPCSDCDTLGYPPIVEIVSQHFGHRRAVPELGIQQNVVITVHGRLALGAPVPVHGEDDQSWDWVPSIEIGDEGAWYYYDQAYCDDPSIETKPSDISDTVAGTLVPGGVAYPVTVAT